MKKYTKPVTELVELDTEAILLENSPINNVAYGGDALTSDEAYKPYNRSRN